LLAYCSFLKVFLFNVLVLALFLEKLLVILLGLVLNTSIAHWSYWELDFDMQLKSLVMGNPKFRGYLISEF